MSTKRTTKSKTRKQIVFYLGIICVVLGIAVMVSSFTMVDFQPMKLTYTGPFGQFSIDSLTPEQEQRIFIGFVITSLGLAMIKIGI